MRYVIIEFEKARKPGAKDINPRKKKGWGTQRPISDKSVWTQILSDWKAEKEGAVEKAGFIRYKGRKPGAKDLKPRKKRGEFSPEDRYSENWHTRTMAKMRDLHESSLNFIIKDATEAADIGEKIGNPKAGQYRDEVHYANMELNRRKLLGTKKGTEEGK